MIPDRIGDLLLDYDRGGRLHIRTEKGRLSVEAEANNQVSVQSSFTSEWQDKCRAIDSLPDLDESCIIPKERRWVARDKGGCLWIYFDNKPRKYEEDGIWRVSDGNSFAIGSCLFPEVKWEDPEPREIVLK